MTRFGYFLSSEETGPAELVQQARMAAEASQVLPRLREA
jgi:hypothetical protein